MPRKKNKGALAYRPGQFALTDEQTARFQELKASGGKKRARKYLRRQDAQGNLVRQGDAPVEQMPEPTVESEPNPQAQSYEQAQTAVNEGINNQITNLNNRPAFQPTGLPQIPTDFMASRQKAADAAYAASTRRMDDRFARDEENLRQRLYNQGVTEGSEKFNNALNDFRENKNAAYADAQNQAYLTGQSEQNMQFGQGLAANQNAFGQQMQTWQAPLQQLQAYSPYYQTGAAGQRLDQQLNYQTGAREDTQQFTSEQAALDFERQKKLAAQQQKYALAQINATPRGGGGGGGPMPFDEWARRQDYAAGIAQQQMFDQAVIGGYGQMPQYQPGFGGGFSSGFGAGVVGGVLS